MRSEHVIQQAGQIQEGAWRLGVFRTLEDEHGPYAVLRLARSGDHQALELTLRPGEVEPLDGDGSLALLDAVPSTRERRGSVRVALEWEPAASGGGSDARA